MNHIRWAALCAVTTILCVPSSVRAKLVSLWTLNNSVISLSIDGPSLAFRYETVRTELRDESVRTGTLLFSVARDGNAISSTEYVVSRRCNGCLSFYHPARQLDVCFSFLEGFAGDSVQACVLSC